MANFAMRNAVLLLKAQSAAGSEATPSVGSDAIRVRVGAAVQPQVDVLQTDFINDSVSQTPPVIGGARAEASGIAAYLAGAGTAGTAPDYGRMLRAGGLSETLTAADITGTAQAGASGSITLEAGETGVLVGHVIETTGGTGSGQKAVVTAWNNTTKVATVYPNWGTTPDSTTTYAVRASALYAPRSTDFEYFTAWLYQQHRLAASDAVRFRMMDALANLQFALRPRQFAEVTASMMGLLPALPDDESNPSAATYASVTPRPWVGATTYLAGLSACLSEFTLDLGNSITTPDCANETYGYASPLITARAPTGQISLDLKNVATLDAVGTLMAGTDMKLWITWGSTAGSRISLYLPNIRLTGATVSDVNGFAYHNLPFAAHGADGEVFINIF